MFQFLVEGGGVADLVKGAVDLDALETLLLQLRQFLAVFALAPAHDGGEQEQPRAFGQGQHAVGHLADRLAFDGKAGGGRIRHADAGEQKPQVIVDLGHGADGRTGIFRGRLLFDGDGGRQPLDMIDIGLLHQFEELTRIGRQAFDITALAFGIDGVEREAGFAGTGQPGDDGQRVARDFHVDILQIVFARAANGDVFLHRIPGHQTLSFCRRSHALQAAGHGVRGWVSYNPRSMVCKPSRPGWNRIGTGT